MIIPHSLIGAYLKIIVTKEASPTCPTKKVSPTCPTKEASTTRLTKEASPI